MGRVRADSPIGIFCILYTTVISLFFFLEFGYREILHVTYHKWPIRRKGISSLTRSVAFFALGYRSESFLELFYSL